jgi:hypothetical protein
VTVGTLQGSAQTGWQAGIGAAHTAGAAGRKQLPQQPQPTVVAARAATARSIMNLVIIRVSILPALVNGERQATSLRGIRRAARERLNSYASRA